MTIIRLENENHSSGQVFRSIQRMCQDHGFTFNEDMSGTETGKLKKEFKLLFRQVDKSSRSNNLNQIVRATIEISLFHNAEGDTDGGHVRALDDIEDLIFEIERFSPSGNLIDVKKFITVATMIRWITEPIKQGDDSRLRTILLFEIEYKIRNPLAQGA